MRLVTGSIGGIASSAYGVDDAVVEFDERELERVRVGSLQRDQSMSESANSKTKGWKLLVSNGAAHRFRLKTDVKTPYRQSACGGPWLRGKTGDLGCMLSE